MRNISYSALVAFTVLLVAGATLSIIGRVVDALEQVVGPYVTFGLFVFVAAWICLTLVLHAIREDMREQREKWPN